tara:strand:+ start:537 stop:1481 length:945 start_codon:yes stop_codon:yes gene_type:complete
MVDEDTIFIILFDDEDEYGKSNGPIRRTMDGFFDDQILEEREKIEPVLKSPIFKEMRKNNGKLTPLLVKEHAKYKANLEHDTIMVLRNAGFKDVIPRVHGYKICDKRDYIFMDYIDGVRLEDFRPVSKNQLSSIIIQVLYTLYKINKKIPSFRHNDLHLENIMIVKDDVKNIIVSDHSGNRFQFNNEGIKIILIDFEDSYTKGVKNDIYTPIMQSPNSIYDTHQFLTSIYLFLHNSSSRILKPMSNISSNKKNEIDNEIMRILRYIEKKIEPQFLDYGNTRNEFVYDGYLTIKGQRKIKNTLDDFISDIKLILT